MAIGIILLAGSSTRYSSVTPKQFELVNNRPLFDYAISTFLANKNISKVVLVTRSDYVDYLKDFYKKKKKILGVIEGGETRQQSVFNSLSFLESKIKSNEKILIHDAARPLVSDQMINDVIATLDEYKSCTIASLTTNTLCQSHSETIENYVDRGITFSIETPQGFIYESLFEAHKRMDTNLFTDDTQLLQSVGIKTKLVISKDFNFKITTKSDMELFIRLSAKEGN